MTAEFKDLNKKEMGARVRARREKLNMSRETLAAILSVTPKTIANIEYGDKGMTMNNLYKLKQALGVSIDYLMDGDATYTAQEDKRKAINENILSSLSVCSERQLGNLEMMTRLYVDSVVNKE